MSDIALRVENLSKRYRIGGRQEHYKRFTETVMDTFSAPIHRLKNLGKPVPPEETIWALKDVSFEVERGEVLGIIGRNGAGKTTLLKILSRITEPTEGRAEIHGRVGSLLEVGTGFHSELTGRENIYLSGAILGMRKAEIDRKFDEIVEFSGVEKFIDTPFKRYSSGMRVRLGFAVAAHLEPEILLVDEVLAVGDAQFQKKCLGKMGEVSKEGRTVLFVSHNMAAIRNLCGHCVLLDNGTLDTEGDPDFVISRYALGIVQSQAETNRVPGTSAYVSEVAICDSSGEQVRMVDGRGRFFLKVRINNEGSSGLSFGCTVFGADGVGLFSCLTDDDVPVIPYGQTELSIELPVGLLHPGMYRVEGALTAFGDLCEQSDNYVTFQCLRGERFYALGRKSKGLLRNPHKWSMVERTSSVSDPPVQALGRATGSAER